MKTLVQVIVCTLALNFLALAGGVGWLVSKHQLDRERLMAIKEIVFPKPVEAAPTTEPSEDPTTRPVMRLEELLASASGRTASEQVDFIQNAFDAKMVILDKRQREIHDLQESVELAKKQMAADRAELDVREKALTAREQQATKLATDQGFKDSLALYTSLPPKQVKTIFLGLDDQTMINYLQAMEPRTASRIVKEFKTPDETKRMQAVMEKMRTAQASIKE
jgi:hypothetical protein